MGRPVVTKAKSARKQAETDLGFSWGMPNTVLLALGIGALGIGYLALAKGSTTLAPVVLVTGYCVLIPAALLVRGRGRQPGE